MFKIIFLFSLVAMISSCSSVGENSAAKKSIIMGKIEFKGASEELTIPQFDAALNVASKLSGRFQSFPYYYWDTLAQKYSSQRSVLELAQRGNIDYIMFANVNVVSNMMRTEIVLTDTRDDSRELTGVGYSAIKYIDAGTGNLVYDPAMLESLERAMAIAVNDSNLFVKPELNLDVKPLPTLVIGTIVFQENEYSPNWEIFEKKEVNSYSGIETIFDVYKRNPNYVVYDSESRDSVYRLFGFNLVENYNSVSPLEVKALYDIAVDYFIAGNLEVAKDSAVLELSLYSVEKNGLKEVKSVKETFTEDKREEFLKSVSEASKRLSE